MKIPPYWVNKTYEGLDQKGKTQKFRAWGWSFENITEAGEHATARAKRVFDALVCGNTPNTYDYNEHPLREEIVESITLKDDEAVVITRNRYGALVLNSSSICFVDIDFPAAHQHSASFFESLRMLFSKNLKREKTNTLKQETIENVRAWSRRNPIRSFRLYQTAAGLRLLFTDKRYDPVSEEVSELFRELGCDTLYAKLTLKQQCFRARLTPKPWRCHWRTPPNRYPWPNAEAEEKYRNWQNEYEEHSESYGVCRFMEELGNISKDDELQNIVCLHDKYTCRREGSTLA